jgi:hypothetical protein
MLQNILYYWCYYHLISSNYPVPLTTLTCGNRNHKGGDNAKRYRFIYPVSITRLPLGAQGTSYSFNYCNILGIYFLFCHSFSVLMIY